MIHNTKKRQFRFLPFAGLLVLAALATGCSTDNSPAVASAAMLDASSAKIRYRYQDSSIPPPGHRSYTLLIDSESSVLTFDAYGEILGEQIQTTEIDKVDMILNRLSLSDLPAVIDKECAGGPAYSLKVADAGDVEVRSILVAPCSNEDAAAVAELRNIIAPVLGLFNVN